MGIKLTHLMIANCAGAAEQCQIMTLSETDDFHQTNLFVCRARFTP